MVDGTGLENQQVNASQVRILSLPPETKEESLLSYFVSEGRWRDPYPVPSATDKKIKERRSLSSELKKTRNREFTLVFLFSEISAETKSL